ncbi:MAG: hypothetical protein KAV87_56500, partial [Desulfobacteraceae bacterium]|nr:hypothetical protein [Desulfobacteraceae bacterium]
MTIIELTRKARDYDNLHNEGGEGYNPHRDELERRKLEAETVESKTTTERRNDLIEKLRIAKLALAGIDRLNDLSAQIATLTSAEKKEIESTGWTLGETKS